MRRQTPFTLEEAKAYLIESVKEWEDTNQIEKIISLAGFAYNRRNKVNTGSPMAIIKGLKTTINSYNKLIKDKSKVNPKADNTNLQKELETYQKSYNSFIEKYGELPAKKPKKSTEK